MACLINNLLKKKHKGSPFITTKPLLLNQIIIKFINLMILVL